MTDDMRVHVIPEQDGHPHTLSMSCECDPIINADGVVVHNSFDDRESLEKITGMGDGRGWSVCYPVKQ